MIARQLRLPTGCEVILYPSFEPCGKQPVAYEPPCPCVEHAKALRAQGMTL